jgi:hypothetical protein
MLSPRFAERSDVPWKLTPAQLRPGRRAEIQSALNALAGKPDVASDPHVSTIRTGGRDIKVLRTPTGYRVFFKQEQDEIEVLDIASRAQIDFLRSTAVNAAA